MTDIAIFASAVGLFFVWLLVKNLTKSHWPRCAVCAAVTTTWVVLLILRALGLYENDLLFAVLIGASATGGYYWLSSYEQLALYKLPIFVTLAGVAYLIVLWQFNWSLVWLMAALWVGFGIIGLGWGNKALVKKIIECCKNW